MLNRTLLLTTTFVLGVAPAYAANTITTDTVNTAAAPMSVQQMSDPRVAATSFIEHVNFARVALAMKNTYLAKQHLTQARNMVSVIKNATSEQRVMSAVESGRIVYKYDTEYKYHYFPLQAGPVQVKQLDNGPLWASNDLAVTDADIVYLTLDLTGDKAETHLIAAEAALNANNLKLADTHLAQLTQEVMTVDNKVAMPSIKARDNIALARSFIAGKNYDGASYALKHADEALDEMQSSDANKPRLTEITAMRKDVATLQEFVSKKDPSMIQKANAKIDQWWNDLNEWSKSTR